jgi:hypothetical protein
MLLIVKKQVTPGGGVQQFLFLRPTPLTSHETQKPPRYLTLLYRHLGQNVQLKKNTKCHFHQLRGHLNVVLHQVKRRVIDVCPVHLLYAQFICSNSNVYLYIAMSI